MIEFKNLPKRLLLVFASIFKILPHRRRLAQSDIIIARNLDMLAIAWVAKIISLRPNIPLIYECLDIHRVFVGSSHKARIARWVERCLLSRCSLLVTSSPGYLQNYFWREQSYSGPVTLLENKLWLEGSDVARPSPRCLQTTSSDDPWVVGWVGSLRCSRSLDMLIELALLLGDKVEISTAGRIHYHAIPDFDERIGDLPNIQYIGPYKYPDGLADIYAHCHFVWSNDLWQPGANSDWALPNRIYEASYFGCLPIGLAGTATGDWIKSSGIGFTIDRADAKILAKTLKSMSKNEVDLQRCRLLERCPSHFRLTIDDVRRSIVTPNRRIDRE